MVFTWTAHRFSGGALALDVANSVILRFDPARRVDRFADVPALDTFAGAANRFCAEAPRFGALLPVAERNRARLLTLREATDRHFRALARDEQRPELLADLLEVIAAILRGNGKDGSALDTATAHSALGLAANPEPDRLKICPNCGWLFLDRSRNRSRTWCDMAVCGNRSKAKRHYHRSKEEVQG